MKLNKLHPVATGCNIKNNNLKVLSILSIMTITLEKIFHEQQVLVNYFFDNLDYQHVDKFVDILLNRDPNGIIYLTGMGKSGIISNNISKMFVSIGIRSMFLSPVDALHGDVGVLRDQDILILFSRSGQTSELINLLPSARNKGSFLVAIVSNLDSMLAEQCDFTICLPLQKELCPFDLAPTTSSIIQLIFGNTIVAELMKKTGLTQEEYSKNHPAGRIGKRLTLSVKDIMKDINSTPISKPYDILIDQIDKMTSYLCGCLIIVDNQNKLLGIFTDGDLRRAISTYGSLALQKPLLDLMTVDPCSCKKEQMAFNAMKEMEREDSQKKKRIKEMPVVDGNNKVDGLILLHDLVNYGL